MEASTTDGKIAVLVSWLRFSNHPSPKPILSEMEQECIMSGEHVRKTPKGLVTRCANRSKEDRALEKQEQTSKGTKSFEKGLEDLAAES